MDNQSGSVERLGPQARLQGELAKLESQNRDIWVLSIFAAVVLLLGGLSFLVPSSFWQLNQLEVRISPQVLFLVMMVVMVVALYTMRRESEVRKLRLVNLQQTLSAQSEFSASMVDSLTNVFSRSFLRELLQGEIARAERNKRPLTLMMCDLNHFKEVNDRFGHLMGDYVLAQIAGILKSCVRGSDYVVRYGGDEFLIVLSETDETGAQIVHRRIEQKLADWNGSNRLGDFSISLSLGLHQHIPGQSAEQAVAESDVRMYSEKARLRAAMASSAPPRIS